MHGSVSKASSVTAILLVLGMCGETFAQPARFHVSPCAGVAFPAGKLADEAEAGYSLGVRFAWYVANDVALEGSVIRDDFGGFTDVRLVENQGADNALQLNENHDYTEYSLRLRLDVPASEFFVLSQVFGIGIYHERAETQQLYRDGEWHVHDLDYSDTDIGYQAVLGCIFFADDPRRLTVEVAYHNLFGDSLSPIGGGETPSFIRIAAGVSFAL
jgi:hypothetical protein